MGNRGETREGLMSWPSAFVYSPVFFSGSNRFSGGPRPAPLTPTATRKFLEVMSLRTIIEDTGYAPSTARTGLDDR
ncbi:MAG: hypothetical protein EDM82_15040 [Cyanobacteria bacterium CYA]|nr:MAG: hypothetical protein EDM82_15040 [Cyanobacteria bacterium CYA]